MLPHAASLTLSPACTTKLKEVVASARRIALKWQSTKEGELLKNKPFKEWLGSRPVTLRPIYWEISIDAYTGLQNGV